MIHSGCCTNGIIAPCAGVRMSQNILFQGIDLRHERKSISPVILLLRDSDLLLKPPWMERPMVNLSESLQYNFGVIFVHLK